MDIRVKAPEGCSTIGQFCDEQHRNQGFVCELGRCAMADGVAELLTSSSESVVEEAPGYDEVLELMDTARQSHT